jgi:WD40 repeat protein
MSVAIHIENPFPGLRPFEPKQADLFFGRDEQVEELLDRLQQQRFLAVVGTSGSGKSSLVRAGVIPALKRGYLADAGRHWRIALLRPGSDPMAELGRALASAFDTAGLEDSLALLRRSSLGLAEFARQHLAEGESLLLVIDQFEELFRYRKESRERGDLEEAAAFVKLLLAASGHSELSLPQWNDLPVYVILTMRSDFLGKCSQFRGLPEALNDSQYLVARMTREQQRESIEGPIDMAAGRIAPQLVQRLLNDVGDNPDQLPVLQHALMRTWEQAAEARARGDAIEVADYEAIGEMRAALNRDADQALAKLAGDQASAALARRIFQRLVEPGADDGETRRPTPLSEMVAVTGATEPEVRRVIDAFLGPGFLTLSQDSDPVIDITHESLIRLWDKLKGWVREEAESAKTYSRLATSAIEGRSLYRDPELTEALRWKAKESPNAAWATRYPPKGDSAFADALEFLQRSRRRQRLFFSLLIAIAILISGLAILASVLKFKADEQRQVADVQKLSANADALSKGPGKRSQLSLLLATEALRRYSWLENDRAIRQALAKSPVFVASMKHDGWVTALQFSPDGKLLWSGSEDKTVRAWDPTSGKEMAQLANPYMVTGMRLSADGRYVAVAGGEIIGDSPFDFTLGPGSLRTWEWNGEGVERMLPDQHFSTPVIAVAFDATNRRVLAVDFKGIRSIPLIGSSQTSEVSLNDLAEDNAILLSESGGSFAVALKDGSIQIRNGQTLQVVRTIRSANYQPAGQRSDNIRPKFLSENWLWIDSTQGSYFYNLKSGKPVPHAIEPGIDAFVVSQQGDLAVALNSSVGFTVLALATGDRLWEGETEQLRVEQTSPRLLLSPDNKRFVVSSGDLVVRVYEVSSHRELFRVSLDTQAGAIAFSPDGQYLAVGEKNGTLTVWRLESGSEYRMDIAPSYAISPTGKFIKISDDSQIKVLDRTDQHQVVQPPPKHYSFQIDIFSADDHYYVSIDGKEIQIYDLREGRKLPPITPGDWVKAMAFTAPATRLVVATQNGVISKWDLPSGNQVEKFEIGMGDLGSKSDFTFSRDAQLCAGRIDFAEFQLWNVDTGVILGKIPVDGYGEIEFSPDGRLVTLLYKATIAVWTTQGSPHEVWHHSIENLELEFDFSPDGRRLAAVWGRDIFIWDAPSGRLQYTLNRLANVEKFAFAPDSKYVAATYGDGVARVWELQNGNAVAEVGLARAEKEGARDISFSPDGQFLIVEDSLPTEKTTRPVNNTAKPADQTSRPARNTATPTEKTTIFRTVWWHPEDLINQACRRLSRNPTQEEWKKYLPDEPYHKICPSLP